MSERPEPWYRAPTDTSPFDVKKIYASARNPKAAFVSSAAFPWHMDSLRSSLFGGTSANDETLQSQWKTMVRKWGGSVIVGSIGHAYVMRKEGEPLCIPIPLTAQKAPPSTVHAVAWAITPRAPTEPMAIIAASKTIFIYELNTQNCVGKLRGHGGGITSIAVHPAWPYMFLTTSRDLTTRLYDLAYQPRQVPNNPHWPPQKTPSFGGPAFGMHSTESEGEGIGRCVGVLVGNRSGGHLGAVFKAAWHPTADIIVTCGMDRAVKIWRVPMVQYEKVNVNEEHLAREDKPLFSTDLMHDSRVLSVAWLRDDILVSHSAPALMRGEHAKEMYEEPGEVIVWLWLGFDRFLKQGQIQPIMRGSISDYRNSDSFKVLARYALPMHVGHVHFYTPHNSRHDPLLLVPDDKVIRIFNISQWKSRPSPEFPLNKRDMSRNTDGQVANDDEQLANDALQALSMEDRPQDEGDDDDDFRTRIGYSRRSPTSKLFDLPCWTVGIPPEDGAHARIIAVEKCEMAWGGRVIIGIGNNSTFIQWQLRR